MGNYEGDVFMSIEFRQKNLAQWETTLKELFPEGIPLTVEWRDLSSIISILNKLGSIPSLNHTFMPLSGGLDLTGAKMNVEQGCIELEFGGIIDVVKPKFLKFYSFPGNDLEWAYFRLETGGILPSEVYEDNTFNYEELTELTPGEYIDRSWMDHGYYGYDQEGNEQPLPETARVVSRVFEGAYVIFSKGSIYNSVSGTYDGRHNKMSDPDFYEYIKRSAAKAEK